MFFRNKEEDILKNKDTKAIKEYLKKCKFSDKSLFFIILSNEFDDDIIKETKEEAKKRDGLVELCFDYIQKSDDIDYDKINRVKSLLYSIPDSKKKMLKLKNIKTIKDSLLLDLIFDEDLMVSFPAYKIGENRSAIVDAFTAVVDESPNSTHFVKSIKYLLELPLSFEHGYYGKLFLACSDNTPVSVLNKLMFCGDPTICQAARYNYASRTKDVKVLHSKENGEDSRVSLEDVMKKNRQNQERVKQERLDKNKGIVRDLNKRDK